MFIPLWVVIPVAVFLVLFLGVGVWALWAIRHFIAGVWEVATDR